jgi:hypothetical protein
MSGLVGSRVWSLTPGQALPSWLSVSSNGSLTARPVTGSRPATLYFDQVGRIADGTSQRSTIKVTVNPVSIPTAAELFVDMQEFTSGTKVFDLNPMVSDLPALAGARTWAITQGQDSAVTSGLTLSTSGELTLSTSVSSGQLRNLFVEVTSVSGVNFTGKVVLNFVNATNFAVNAALGQTQGSSINLRTLTANDWGAGFFRWSLSPGSPDLPAGITAEEVLARPEMQHVEVPEGPGSSLVPRHACEGFGADGESLGRAAPGRRFVEMAALVPGSVVTSICTDDFGPAIEQIAHRIGREIQGVCLARSLPTTGERVDCSVTVTLPAGRRCGEFAAYEADGLDGPRARCRVAQVDGVVTSGFRYDGGDEACPRLSITEDAQPPVGSVVRAECYFDVLLEDGADCIRDGQCASQRCDRLAQACAPEASVAGPTAP